VRKNKCFTSVAPCQGTTLQAAKKLNKRGFVTGHDFSRADNASKMNRALAPANPSFAGSAFRSDFFPRLAKPGIQSCSVCGTTEVVP
jgi:hypothetical protein